MSLDFGRNSFLRGFFWLTRADLRSVWTNADGLPQWPAFTAEKGATMVFDSACEVKYNPDKALLEFVSEFPGQGF